MGNTFCILSMFILYHILYDCITFVNGARSPLFPGYLRWIQVAPNKSLQCHDATRVVLNAPVGQETVPETRDGFDLKYLGKLKSIPWFTRRWSTTTAVFDGMKSEEDQDQTTTTKVKSQKYNKKNIEKISSTQTLVPPLLLHHALCYPPINIRVLPQQGSGRTFLLAKSIEEDGEQVDVVQAFGFHLQPMFLKLGN